MKDSGSSDLQTVTERSRGSGARRQGESAVVRAGSREQLDAIYRELTARKSVLAAP
jgi:putative lipoic acid-binding regulatory protein